MERKYLILDSRGKLLCHGRSNMTPPAPSRICKLEVDENADRVLDHEYIRLVSMSDDTAVTEGRVLGSRGSTVEIEIVCTLGEEIRRNLRIPVRFESFLYPVSGNWKGRAKVVSHDLSCGGVSFFCDRRLEIGETAEIVIPVTLEPLILNLKILRIRPSSSEEPLYAAKFIHTVHEEESMVREAVFSLQLQQEKR